MRCLPGSIPEVLGPPKGIGILWTPRYPRLPRVVPCGIPRSPGNPSPKYPGPNLVGMEAAKLEVDFSASMWQHRSSSERRTLCKACEASVHKCDTCQALFLGSWGPPRASASSKGLGIPDYLETYPRSTRGVADLGLSGVADLSIPGVPRVLGPYLLSGVADIGIPGLPRVLGPYLVGTLGSLEVPVEQALKSQSDYSITAWHNKADPNRRTVCLECEQAQTASTHTCDACQAVME